MNFIDFSRNLVASVREAYARLLQMNFIDFSRNLVALAMVLALATLALCFLGLLTRDRRLVLAGRRAMYAGGAAVTGAAAGLVACFFLGAYQVQYVFSYSEDKLAAPFKFAGLWAGLQGSILFWAAILGLVGVVVAWGFGRDRDDPVGRRLEPWVLLVYASVQCFFLGMIWFVADPFAPMEPGLLGVLSRQGLLQGGVPVDGSGLNPLLENYWMMIHPPSVYTAFILYTVPFAFGLGSLMAGELGAYWIRKTRRWTLVAWVFNTHGIILGGLWAYEVLGWGGYWAWDPVENSSFLPWLAGTAFLHSVMIQERRDMLRVWNVFLICLTFMLTIFGTYLTRSGLVSSVHAFASGGVAAWFQWFLLGTAAVSLFLIFFRWEQLRSRHRIDSLMSREAFFLFNNMVLLALTVAVVILTLWPKISLEFLGEAVSVQLPVYNQVCTPFFVLLLLLTAVGPSMGWIRTSPGSLARNLLVPALLSLPVAAAVQWVAWTWVRGGEQGEPLSMGQQFYPTGVVVYLCVLIVTSLAWEVARTAAGQARRRRATWGSAFWRLVTVNNRRYGGYLVHVGLALLGLGIVVSSMYRIHREVRVEDQGKAVIGPYELQVRGVQDQVPVSAYLSTKVHVDVMRDGRTVASMEPEKRHYPATGMRREEQTTTEVSIARRLGEDLYIYFERPAEGGGFVFSVFRNPLMNLVWAGWVLMIVGGIWAALPLGKKRVGLAD